MCILALCRACVCPCVRTCHHVGRTSTVNLRGYGDTPKNLCLGDTQHNT